MNNYRPDFLCRFFFDLFFYFHGWNGLCGKCKEERPKSKRKCDTHVEHIRNDNGHKSTLLFGSYRCCDCLAKNKSKVTMKVLLILRQMFNIDFCLFYIRNLDRADGMPRLLMINQLYDRWSLLLSLLLFFSLSLFARFFSILYAYC